MRHMFISKLLKIKKDNNENSYIAQKNKESKGIKNMPNKILLEKYARLAVVTGANVQKRTISCLKNIN